MDINKRIRKNQKRFLAMEQKLPLINELSTRCEWAYEAATFASKHTTDVFSSEEIESAFLELARKHSIDLPEEYRAGTMLHVMTEAYVMGGHTRCVERWVTQLNEFEHSCVVLEQKVPFPEQLRSFVEKSGGRLYRYDVKQSKLERALALRRMASEYEYVVLHVHTNDPMPLIAFGTEEFKRPIIFFNHADHGFWLGVSISDCVADLSRAGMAVSKEKRGTHRSMILGIPQDYTPNLSCEQQEARKRLGIPEDKRVIFASGQEAKFAPMGHPSFYDIVSDVVNKDRNILFYVAGPKASQGFWPQLKSEFPENIFLTGYLDYAREYPQYVAAADLVVDSYPVAGATTMIDAIRAGKPVLTMGQMADYILSSQAYCRSYPEFLTKLFRILNDAEYAKSCYEEVCGKLLRETDASVWHHKCMDIISALPTEHRVKLFRRPPVDDKVSPLSLAVCRWVERDGARSAFRNLRRKFFLIRFKRDEKLIRLFGITLLHIRKRNFA